jgi:hypothetical protein
MGYVKLRVSLFNVSQNPNKYTYDLDRVEVVKLSRKYEHLLS